jgi:adenine C2-methylase RlmN of 23S rRNA A2503 and tRNA A37
MKHATLDDYTTQLKIVLAHANKVDPVFSRINVNFMARGDCLSNATVVNHYDKLYTRLIDTVAHNQSPDTKLKMNLSTIMPASTMRKRSLLDVTKYRPVSWYYSLYSTNERFRREWMPRALPYQEALVKLKEFQLATNYEITIHFAFIKGANDDPRDVEHMCKVLQDMRFSHAKFNLVRFNPPPGQASRMQEPDMAILQQYEEMLRAALGAPAHRGKIIDRVGMDVAASCGMFVASR